MADLKITRPEYATDSGRPLVELWHDNGDGTWSLQTYSGGSAAGGGLKARSTNPAAATDGAAVSGFADLLGRSVVELGQVRQLRGKQNTTITSSTAETTIITAAAATFNDLVAVIISNTSATAVRLDFRDTTGGTILFSLEIPALDVRGFVIPGYSIPQTSVNTNWTVQSSASVADLRILSIFEKNA